MCVNHVMTLPFFVTKSAINAGRSRDPLRALYGGGMGPPRPPIPGRRAILTATNGHAADNVMAVNPAMLVGCRNVTRGDSQHDVGKPHVQIFGQV